PAAHAPLNQVAGPPAAPPEILEAEPVQNLAPNLIPVAVFAPIPTELPVTVLQPAPAAQTATALQASPAGRTTPLLVTIGGSASVRPQSQVTVVPATPPQVPSTSPT